MSGTIRNVSDKTIPVFLIGDGSFELKPFEQKWLDRAEAWAMLFVTLNQKRLRDGLLKFTTADRKLELFLDAVLKGV